MQRIIGFYFFLSFVFITLSPLKGMEHQGFQNPKPLEVIVNGVGQGNCIIVKFPSNEIMLIDCGSSGYQAASKIASETFTPKKHSTAKHARFAPDNSDKITTVEVPRVQAESAKEIIDSIKNKIGGKLKTIIITHPDKDHYGWIMNVLDETQFDYMVLGGMPEKYLESETSSEKEEISNNLSDFIRRHHNRVYFTALSSKAIGYQDQVLESKEPARFNLSGEELKKKFGNAFDFGKDFEVTVLAMNASHVQSLNKKTTINMSLTENGDADHNTDSIILKIKDLRSGKSIIFTGDATGITTTRLMDYVANCPKPRCPNDLLKADVLIASHHGASSHGTNNKAWIETVQPKFVIISTGGRYGHPTKSAFENFQHENIAKVDRHSVFVGGISDNESKNYKIQKGVFSTVPHDDIEIVFTTGKAEKIEIRPENSQTKIFTELPKSSRKKREMQNDSQTENEMIIDGNPSTLSSKKAKTGSNDKIHSPPLKYEIQRKLGGKMDVE